MKKSGKFPCSLSPCVQQACQRWFPRKSLPSRYVAEIRKYVKYVKNKAQKEKHLQPANVRKTTFQLHKKKLSQVLFLDTPTEIELRLFFLIVWSPGKKVPQQLSLKRKAFRCLLLCKRPPLLAEIKRSIERNPGYLVALELDLELAVFDEPRCISAASPRPFLFYAFAVYMWRKSLANITNTVAMLVPDRRKNRPYSWLGRGRGK